MENNEKKDIIYGNASFGIPEDCTKKQKFNGIKLCIYIICVTALCTAIYGGYKTTTERLLPDMSFDKSHEPIVYIKNLDILAKTFSDSKGSFISSSDKYKSDKNDDLIKITSGGKYIFYAEESENSPNGYDLLRKRIEDSEKSGQNQSPDYISRGVTSYEIQPDGRFVVYLKGTDLFLYDFSGYNFISPDVTEFYLSENSQQIIFFNSDNAMFTCEATKDAKPSLVDDGIERLFSEKNEYNLIYYLKEGALFTKSMGKPPVLIDEGVTDGILLDEFMYYTKNETLPLSPDDIFTDKNEKTDKSLKKPVKADYIKTLSDGTSHFNDLIYKEDLSLYEKKLLRDSVREYLSKNPITYDTTVLYTVKNEIPKMIDINLTDDALSYNSSKQAIVYKRFIENEPLYDIEDITSVSDAVKEASEFIKSEKKVGLSLLVKDKAPFIAFSHLPNGQMEISLDRKYLYIIENVDRNGRGTLNRYTISQKELRDKEEIKQGVTKFFLDGADSQILMVFDGDKLGISNGNNYTHLSDNSSETFFYVDRTLFFFDDYNKDAKTGNLKYFRDGKAKLIDMSVYSFDVRNLKNVSYIKHYNKEYDMGNLYVKDGNKRGKQIDICVNDIIH